MRRFPFFYLRSTVLRGQGQSVELPPRRGFGKDRCVRPDRQQRLERLDINNLCTMYLGKVQRQLDGQKAGIRVQCGKSATGEYALQVVDLPESIRLSKAAMERVLGNVELFLSLQGSWAFTFK